MRELNGDLIDLYLKLFRSCVIFTCSIFYSYKSYNTEATTTVPAIASETTANATFEVETSEGEFFCCSLLLPHPLYYLWSRREGSTWRENKYHIIP